MKEQLKAKIAEMRAKCDRYSPDGYCDSDEDGEGNMVECFSSISLEIDLDELEKLVDQLPES